MARHRPLPGRHVEGLRVGPDSAWHQDGRAAWSSRVYHELLQLASVLLARQPMGQLLLASDLVHDAWLRLAAGRPHWQSRAHFMAAIARAMRCILIDQARQKATTRHGAGWQRTDWRESDTAAESPGEQSAAIHDALERLAARDLAKSDLVTLRYFDGLTLKEAATALGISESTAKRYWTYSRTWLRQEMRRMEQHESFTFQSQNCRNARGPKFHKTAANSSASVEPAGALLS
ncbi:MAG: ECF-type sigma factor [Acidobacteriales bacterium]|nr:ECF-type sigma factor [Terriglobales bacterium]